MILGMILVRFCSQNHARIVPNFDRPDYAICFCNDYEAQFRDVDTRSPSQLEY
jgi:hypothetical protein